MTAQTDETAELEEYYPFGNGDADPVVIWHEGPERTNGYNLLSKEFNKSVYSPESASDPAATATVDSGLVNLQENQSLPDCLNLNSPSIPFRQ